MSNYKPVFKPDQVAAFPWLRSDDDHDDAGGPRAGPVQVPDGPLHAALDLPELEDSLGSTDTPDKVDYGGSAPLDEMQELNVSYATETEDEFTEVHGREAPVRRARDEAPEPG